MRLADRSSDDGEYVELELKSPLQAELIKQWLLTDPDGQPDINVHGALNPKELMGWLAPIIGKWGEIEVLLKGDEISE